jgi:hypothetical protein
MLAASSTEVWGSPGSQTRLLYRLVEKAEQQYQSAVSVRLRPFAPRNGKTPSRPERQLARLAHGWAQPSYNRVRSYIGYQPGRFGATDLRLVATERQFPGWVAPGPLLRLVQRKIVLGLRHEDKETQWPLYVSLHAVERYYERQRTRILQPLMALLPVWDTYVRGEAEAGDFSVSVPGGVWRCGVAEVDGLEAVCVRTFTHARPC